MAKLLLVDDDDAVREMIRMRLSDGFEVVDTASPEQALALALEHKPDAILLDLMMPGFSGFELCQSLHSLSYTSRTPIFIISGEAGAKYREHCEALGAKAYFQKPVDFAALKSALTAAMREKQPERRAHVRVRMSVVLKLRGKDAKGSPVETMVTTENVSAGGFLCTCPTSFVKNAVFDVFLTSENQDRFAGKAEVVRQEAPGSPWQKYGFRFKEITSDWVLQPM